ncbi:MAG TPA: MBL fold metallo-hydrolase [Terriglobales bacterium]|nr:MBL fold metallo-hydrolase [Terriglobales bacterium]
MTGGEQPGDDRFRLQVKFWGVRGSIATPQQENLGFGGNTTCIEVRLPNNEVVIIDGGTGLRYLGIALTLEQGNQPLFLRFLITHFHWDHIQGIPFFSPLYAPSNQVDFYSDYPPEQLQRFLQGQMSCPYFPLAFERLAARRRMFQIQSEFRIGDLRVHSFPLNHPQGATGYRLELNGAVVVHASDLEHGDKKLDTVLLDHAQNADLLIYDAQYTPEEYTGKKGWGHSTWLEAVRTAREAKVKKLILFHHDPSHGDQFMEELVLQARSQFENTEAAVEGCNLSI